MDNESLSRNAQLKASIKSAFTDFPYCIATYLALAGFLGFLIVGIKYHLSR